MEPNQKTVIVTGASQGVGAGVVQAFLSRGYNIVGTSRSATKSKKLSASDHLALIDGDIGQFETAQKVAELAIRKFGSIDALVANAGIYFVKPFTEYTAEDFRALVSTNLEGFIYIAQLAVNQMQAQKSGGSIVSITASLAQNPIAGIPVSVPMMTKGGLEAALRSLASEYAKEHIRFNAVASEAWILPARIGHDPVVAMGGHGWPWVARSSGVAESGRLVRRMSHRSIRPRLPKKLEPCGWMPFSGLPDGPFRWGIVQRQNREL